MSKNNTPFSARVGLRDDLRGGGAKRAIAIPAPTVGDRHQQPIPGAEMQEHPEGLVRGAIEAARMDSIDIQNPHKRHAYGIRLPDSENIFVLHRFRCVFVYLNLDSLAILGLPCIHNVCFQIQ